MPGRTKSRVDVRKVVNRLRKLHGVDSDIALGQKLRLGSSTVSNWVQRDSIPYDECVAVALRFGCSLDWLLLGIDEAGVPENDDPRLRRLQTFLAQWTQSHNEQENAWLEIQLARTVPEYEDWLKP